MDIHTILVPYDFSEYAEHAFIWAVSLAEQWRARIVLLHAVPLLHHVSVPEHLLINIPQLDTDRVIEAEEHLQDFLMEKRELASVTVETRVVRGDPFGAICQAAKQEHADLIVMGSHGRTGLAHVLLGSVAERIVRHALCPVLITRRSPAQ
jgi:nucleotide-binding universal stress UspA family protein